MGTKLVERGITRYDIEEQGTYGFMMRISRNGNHINEFFSDKNSGGKRKALEAARKRYKKLKAKLPPPKTTKGIKTARNRTGVVGVHLAVCESVYGEMYSSYCASWKTGTGGRSKLSFSFKKYGKRKAWELACLARELESSDRSRVEKLYEKRKKKKVKTAPSPKAIKTKVEKKSKKKAKKKTAKKTKKKVTKKKVTKKKAKKKPAKKKVKKKTKKKTKKSAKKAKASPKKKVAKKKKPAKKKAKKRTRR